ncbi:MAG: MFS transporter [Candidatus Methanofastidiosia archaeon]|jgi:MFS family permease
MTSITDEITDYIKRLQSFSKNSKIVLFSYALTRVGFGVFWVILNLYILELGFSTKFLGTFISSHLVASAIFLIPGGAVSDWIGRKKTLLLSIALMVVSVGVLVTAQGKYMLIFANILRGAGDSLILVTIAPFMMEQSKKYERMHLFSVNAAVSSFSIMVGTLVGGILPSVFAVTVSELAHQYQYTLVTTAGFFTAAFLPLLFIEEKYEPLSSLSKSKELAPVFLENKKFVLQFVVYSSLIGLGAGIIVPFFNVYFSQALHATSAQIGFIFSVSQLTVGIAQLLLPLLVKKFGRVKATVITQFLSIPFFLLILLSNNLGIAFLSFFMRMSFMNMAYPAQQNFYMDHVAEHERAKANSISQFGSTVLRAVGSSMGGILIATGSFSQPFYTAALVYVAATSMFYIFFRKKE